MQNVLNSTTPSHLTSPRPETLGTEEVLTFPAFFKSTVSLWVKFLLSVGLCFFAVQLVTWLPDIDHWFVGILHHRSILTHSVLLPAIVWIALPKSMPVIASVLFAAVGIHLSADVLSPSQGYGAIWLPEPFKLNLGELSKVWLSVNAVMAFVFALKSCPEQHRYPLTGGALGGCIFYGFANENSGLAAVLSVAFLTFGYLIARRLSKFPESPIQISRRLMSQRVRTQQLAKLEKQRLEAERGHFYFIKRVLRLPYQAFCALWFVTIWSLRKPRTAGSIAALVVIAFISFYLVGSSSSNSFAGAVSNGAAKTLSDGVWVLHSSGGWILKQGGEYVAGTLRATKP